MTCEVAMLAQLKRKHSEIFCNSDENSERYGEACAMMEACRLLTSHETPTSEQGWAFLAYVLAWYDRRGDRRKRLLKARASHTLSHRHDNWGKAA
jgi:hypothetical protein